MANKSRSKTAEAAASQYKSNRTWETNRLTKLERALKRNPENKEIELAMKNVVYRRKTPKTRMWSSTKRNTAILFKKFTGKVNLDIFSSNEKISVPALAMHSNVPKVKPFAQGSMFKLATRAHDGKGNLVWS